jgi:hypothetical protein
MTAVRGTPVKNLPNLESMRSRDGQNFVGVMPANLALGCITVYSHSISFLSIYHLETNNCIPTFTQMAVPNGHAVHLASTEKRPLILTLGQIRVSVFLCDFKENQC